jgi:hypothetical protein
MRSEAKRRRDKDSPRMCLPDMRFLAILTGTTFGWLCRAAEAARNLHLTFSD